MIITILMLIMTVSGCQVPDGRSEGDLRIVCTVFPQYDWVRQILGDNAENFELTLLSDNGVDLHSYQPTADDILKIAESDLFIYVGGKSDAWVKNVLEGEINPDIIVINLLDVLEDNEHDSPGCDDPGHNHGHEDDEHVWLSLRNAKTFSAVIAEAIMSLAPDNAGEYYNNLNAYMERLSVLDTEYQTAVNAAVAGVLIFGDRFPFRYLTQDYGIGCYAAFPGCSAETEVSFSTIAFLAAKIDELNLKNIMVTENADKSIAETIIGSTADKNQQIFVLNSMQSITSGDISNGITYISIMEYNLETLKEALN
jgi:zinc transport system substrate-binding protein